MARRSALALALLALLGVAAPAVADDGGPSAEAVRIAREARARWTLGAVRVRTHHGSRTVEIELVVDGRIVARLGLVPGSDGFVDRHAAPRTKTPAGRGAGDPGSPRADPGALRADRGALRASALRALPALTVGDAAWPSDHGRAWRVPLRYEGHVVATIRVDPRRGRLLAKEHHDEDDERD